MHPTPTSAELPRGIHLKRAALVLDLALGNLLCVIGTAVMPVIFLVAMLAMLRLPKMVKVSRLIGKDQKKAGTSLPDVDCGQADPFAPPQSGQALR